MPKAAPTASRAGSPAEGRELRARGQRTVRKLLDAGIQVFGAKGYHAARVDDIVKVAKTSHGTFYLYFANKEDLFRALVLDVADEMSALVDSIGELTPDEAGYDMLRDWLARFAESAPAVRSRSSERGPRPRSTRASSAASAPTSSAASPPRSATASRPSPAVVPEPQLAALAIVAMVERCNYYAMTGQIDGARRPHRHAGRDHLRFPVRRDRPP